MYGSKFYKMHFASLYQLIMKCISLKNRIVFGLITLLSSFSSQSQIPALEWVKGILGKGSSQSTSIKTDLSGNVYISGYFYGTLDFDPGPDSLMLTSSSNTAFISKYNPQGSLIWVKELSNVFISEIAIDFNDDIVCAGSFTGIVDFDPGTAVNNLSTKGYWDMFILKLDNSGNFKWAKSLGGNETELSQNIAIDSLGNIYLDGFYNSIVDCDPGLGEFNLSVKTGQNWYQMFLAKYDKNGDFIWAFNTGVADIWINCFERDYTKGYRGSDIVVDAFGNIISTGKFNNKQDLNPTSDTFNLQAIKSDVYVTKFNLNGDFIWAKQFAGNAYAAPSNVVADNLGNIFITGSFNGTVDFDPGLTESKLIAHIGSDIFITKLNSSGELVWAKNIGNSEVQNFGQCIDLDTIGNVFVSGGFSGTMDFDPSAGFYNLTALDTQLFVAKYSSDGNFEWVKHIEVLSRIPQYQHDSRHYMAVDRDGAVYHTGYFRNSVDFDPDAGKVILTASESQASYIHKMSYKNAVVHAYPDYEFILYPNPANRFIIIKMKNATQTFDRLEIINSSGKVCLDQTIDESNSRLNINIENLKPGFYIIKLSNSKKSTYLKFIKN